MQLRKRARWCPGSCVLSDSHHQHGSHDVQANTRWAAPQVSRCSPPRNQRPPSTLGHRHVTLSRRCSFLLTMRRATTASAHPAQQQQTPARVWVPSSCPPMKAHHNGDLDLARGSVAMPLTLQGLESTTLKCCTLQSPYEVLQSLKLFWVGHNDRVRCAPVCSHEVDCNIR